MRNDTETKIVITMRHVDNANRLVKRLQTFFDIADEGGDVDLLVDHNGTIKKCGFVAHDLRIRSIDHIKPKS